MSPHRSSNAKPKDSHLWVRGEGDWYVEPQWATDILLKHERFVGLTWDPACGGGNICKAMLAVGMSPIGTDIERRAPGLDPWWQGERDFLYDPWFPYATNVICNPPFFKAKGTEAFIRRALSEARGKVAIFTDVKFLASQRRAEGLFAEHCPHRVWHHARRPSCPPGEYLAAGAVAGGGTADWCWLVWDNTIPKAWSYQGGWLREVDESGVQS